MDEPSEHPPPYRIELSRLPVNEEFRLLQEAIQAQLSRLQTALRQALVEALEEMITAQIGPFVKGDLLPVMVEHGFTGNHVFFPDGRQAIVLERDGVAVDGRKVWPLDQFSSNL